jgi:hypothetical protein
VTGSTQFHIGDPAAPSETILVTNISGTSASVTRGADGTTPVAHTLPFTVKQVIPAGWLSSVPIMLQPTAQTSGVLDTAYLNAAAAQIGSGGGRILAAAGTFYWTGGGTTITNPGIYIDGAGRFATIVSAVGTGAVVRMYSTAAYSPGVVAGGGIKGLTFDLTNAGAGSCAVHAGDIYGLEWDFGVRNSQGSGSKGVWFDNNYWYAEQMTGKIWVEECTAGVVFDNSANTSGSATGSFDRAVLDIFLDQKGKGNGVVFQGGAFVSDGRIGIYGNTDYGSALYYVLTLTGSNAGGYSLIKNSVLNIGVECNGTSGTQPGTINFASQANNIIWQCTGILDFSGNNPFAHASNFVASFLYDGPVYGDTDLQPSGPLGLYPYKFGALSNGNTIPTKYQAITEVTTTANVTGVILQGYTTDDWRTVYVMNNGTGSITFAASGTSNVASGTACVISPNSMQAFTWNNDQVLWFPAGMSLGQAAGTPSGGSPAGCIAQTMPWWYVSGSAIAAASGTLYLHAVTLPGAVQVSDLTFAVGSTSGATLTHGWYVLLNSSWLQVAHTADQTSGSLAAATAVTKALVTPYTPPATAPYYVGYMVVAGTQPTFCGSANVQGGSIFAEFPSNGPSSTGLTTPGTDGTTSYAAITAAGDPVYGYCS